MNNLNLMLHCGAERVDYHDPILCTLPKMLGPRHAPVRHIDLIDQTQTALESVGLRVLQAQYGAQKDGSRFFGLIEVGNGYQADDYSTVIGVRACYDQAFAASFAAGAGVFVCDNLCFSGEVKLSSKQTTHFIDRLPSLVSKAVTKTKVLIDHQHERYGRYKEIDLAPRVGDAAITELVRRGAINSSQVGKVVKEWDTPSHPEFAEGQNIWRLHNAVTEVYKPANGHTQIHTVTKRSQLLTEMCDQLAGINF